MVTLIRPWLRIHLGAGHTHHKFKNEKKRRTWKIRFVRAAPATVRCINKLPLRNISDQALCNIIEGLRHSVWKRIICLYVTCTCWKKQIKEKYACSYRSNIATACKDASDIIIAKRASWYKDVQPFVRMKSELWVHMYAWLCLSFVVTLW